MSLQSTDGRSRKLRWATKYASWQISDGNGSLPVYFRACERQKKKAFDALVRIAALRFEQARAIAERIPFVSHGSRLLACCSPFTFIFTTARIPVSCLLPMATQGRGGVSPKRLCGTHRAPHQFAATVWATTVQPRRHAVPAKGALERADKRLG